MKLKPCPFCGGEVIVVYQSFGGIYMIVCNKCGMLLSNKAKDTRKHLIEAWNRRESEGDK